MKTQRLPRDRFVGHYPVVRSQTRNKLKISSEEQNRRTRVQQTKDKRAAPSHYLFAWDKKTLTTKQIQQYIRTKTKPVSLIDNLIMVAERELKIDSIPDLVIISSSYPKISRLHDQVIIDFDYTSLFIKYKRFNITIGMIAERCYKKIMIFTPQVRKWYIAWFKEFTIFCEQGKRSTDSIYNCAGNNLSSIVKDFKAYSIRTSTIFGSNYETISNHAHIVAMKLLKCVGNLMLELEKGMKLEDIPYPWEQNDLKLYKFMHPKEVYKRWHILMKENSVPSHSLTSDKLLSFDPIKQEYPSPINKRKVTWNNTLQPPFKKTKAACACAPCHYSKVKCERKWINFPCTRCIEFGRESLCLDWNAHKK